MTETIVSRQEHLQRLGDFLRALARSVPAIPSGLGGATDAWKSAIAGECVQCGVHVSGQELLATVGIGQTEARPQKLTRLSQGYCARNGCTSYYYRLTFKSVPGLNWDDVLSLTATAGRGTAPSDVPEHRPRLAWTVNWQRLSGILLLLLAAVTLVLIHQWHVGGSIPWIREPEHFQVDHSGSGELGVKSP